MGTLNYQYDPIGRLIKSQSAHLSESFDFDPAGNLIDGTQQGSTVKNNLIKSYQGKSYKYDAQGNVIETQHAGKNLKLTWDNLNRLSRSELNGKVTDYAYDVFGRRIYKKSQDSGTTLFGWDGDLMVWESLQATDETQNYTKHYIYEPNSFVPMVQAGYGSFIKLLDTPDYSQFKDQPYSMQRDPVWKTDSRYQRAEIERAIFYHCDQVGTPQTLSNETGNSVWQITQDTWGKALEIKASDNLLEQTNIRFQGQYYDTETGLHYNRFRYYEPHSARYIGKDPIGLDGGLNTSAYVSDPNGWVDPMGLVAYTGTETIYTALVGSKGKYKLTSQCINNYEVTLDIDAYALGNGKSLVPGSITDSNVTFYDNNSTIYVPGFNGAWGGASTNIAVLGKNRSFGGTAIGSATTNIEGSQGSSTTNVGIGALLGKVTSVKESWKYCGKSEEPKCGPGGCFDKRLGKIAPGFSPAPTTFPTLKTPHPGSLAPTPPSADQINYSLPRF